MPSTPSSADRRRLESIRDSLADPSQSSSSAPGGTRQAPGLRSVSGQADIRGRSERRQAVHGLLAAAGLTLVLYAVPYADVVALPLLWLSTLAHEMGHGVAALLAGGSFEWFKMWPDGSGVAWTSVPESAFRSAFVAMGGLLGPAVVAAVLFALGTRARRARISLGVAGALLLLACLLVVRNGFGLAFCAATGAVLLLIGRRATDRVAQITLLFLAVQLTLSVYSRGDYLFAAEARTASGLMPSDSALIATALGGPYWFWGGLVAAVSVAVLLLGLYRFVRSDGRRRGSTPEA